MHSEIDVDHSNKMHSEMDVDHANKSLSASEVDNPKSMFIPECDISMIPKLGQSFFDLKKGHDFYESYAAAGGFSVRKSTLKLFRDGSIRSRLLVCSCEGKKSNVLDDDDEEDVPDKTKRTRFSSRTGCRAMIQFYWRAGRGFVVSKFVDGHNHILISGGYRSHMKNFRNVDIGHQAFVARCAKANIGPSRSFRIFKELVGGFDEVGCKKTDFKNLSRDMKLFADGNDAKLLLDKFRRMRKKNKEFFFDYCVDDTKRLMRIFWADAVSVQNYKIFGDSVSFDATYQTNRYVLIFAPFTGRDNHGKCVTFGAGLISQENTDSYAWLLTKFVECMGKPPVTLITDRDLGLRATVPRVLPNTRHRFCMWHIMMKVPDKIPVALRGNEELSKRFKKIVYSNVVEPQEFEVNWLELMTEFGLLGHKWFEEMFELRTHWIASYFRDVFMSGLFRTTLMSESENSFFKLFLKKRANLSHLYMLFESAMESQGEDHDGLTLADERRTPDMITKVEMERHASYIYTSKIFLKVQKEIELSVMFCTVQGTKESNSVINFHVDEGDNRSFVVKYDCQRDYISCSCKKFTRKGLVCQHMFAVMRNMKYKSIPNKYIITRWTKKACSVFDSTGQNRFASDTGKHVTAGEGLFVLANKCVALSQGDEEKTKELTQVLNGFLDSHSVLQTVENQKNGKQKVLEKLYGVSNVEGEEVRTPQVVKSKGSCSTMVKTKVAAIEKAKKPKRLCRKCGELGYHDSRNCDSITSKEN